MFHIGILAEYHEYSLRLLFHNYVNELETVEENTDGIDILTDDTKFAKAVESYQYIVTHCLCVKIELWVGLFINLAYGVTDGLLSNEFATRRGQIIFHSVLYPMREHPPCNESPMATYDEDLHVIPNITFD